MVPIRWLYAFLVLLLLPIETLAQSVSPRLYEGLEWRLIGPWRGGRSLACAGSQARPNEYYFGATGGGVWKTTDGGQNWTCVSDGFFRTSSVGAIAISETNPDIVYVGMGERDIRGNISHGDGVYKTTDGGRTWRHMGLKETQTIGRIVVHPSNPNIVYVAALGHIFGPNKERGVYKSTNGGETWDLILHESERAGAVHITMDVNHPDTLFAATWDAWRTPYFMNSGGPGSKLWKTTDGGRTWRDISRNPGLPRGILGKIGVSVSPVDSQRIYAIIEAEDGGVFMSDDGGATWQMMSNLRSQRQRAWYYTHIYADTGDRDTCYVLNVQFFRSTDAGRTWRTISVPHVDNHDLWIAPDNPRRMINANDGGANVSTNGGQTWTDQQIPTAQFYHVTTDNHFPYRVYGAQQDNSTIRILSRSRRNGITREDWEPTAGGESGYLAPKPDDPEIVFGGSYGGYLQMRNHRTGESRNVNIWPDNPMGHGARDLVHRVQWTFPIHFSHHDPNKIFTCSQYVMVSTNMGQTWRKMSPDLTRNDPSTMGPSGGPITRDNTSVEYYGTVFAIAESPILPNIMWAGSDDGLVHITRDSGASWQNVTPPMMPKWALVSIIEASPHDPAMAYLAVTNYKNDDHTPYVYVTRNYGRTWRLITRGIPEDDFVRVVREDPVRAGLLYVGTETGVYVSFDGGEHWQSLQMNLPVTPIHNLVRKDNDLVVATHGRSFWILDDVTPLLHARPGMENRPVFFPPPDAYRVTWGGSPGPNAKAGANPPSGFVLTYYLPEGVDRVVFEFTDPWGETVHTVNGPTGSGVQRVATTIRYPSFRNLPGMIMWSAGPRPIPAPPGVYTVTMRLGDWSETRTVRLRNIPGISASEADTVAQFLFARQISERTQEANDAVAEIRRLKSAIDDAITADGSFRADGEALKAQLSSVEEEIYQVRLQSGQDPLNFPIKLNNKIAALLGVVLQGDFRPTDQAYEVFHYLSQQLQVELDRLEAIKRNEGARFDQRLRSRGHDPVFERG